MIRVYEQQFRGDTGSEHLKLIDEYPDIATANFHGESDVRERCQNASNFSLHNYFLEIDGNFEKFENAIKLPILHEWDGKLRKNDPIQIYIEVFPHRIPIHRSNISSYPNMDIANSVVRSQYWDYRNMYGEKFTSVYPKVWDLKFRLFQLAVVRERNVVIEINGEEEVIKPNEHAYYDKFVRLPDVDDLGRISTL